MVSVRRSAMGSRKVMEQQMGKRELALGARAPVCLARDVALGPSMLRTF